LKRSNHFRKRLPPPSNSFRMASQNVKRPTQTGTEVSRLMPRVPFQLSVAVTIAVIDTKSSGERATDITPYNQQTV